MSIDAHLLCATADDQKRMALTFRTLMTRNLSDDLSGLNQKPILWDHFAIETFGGMVEAELQQKELAKRILSDLIMEFHGPLYNTNGGKLVDIVKKAEAWVLKNT